MIAQASHAPLPASNAPPTPIVRRAKLLVPGEPPRDVEVLISAE